MTRHSNLHLRGLARAVCLGLGLTAAGALAAQAGPAADKLPAKYREAGVIKLATEANYPPFQTFADDGKTMVGFEVDLWNEIAKRLGVKIDATSVAFDSLIPGVQSGRWDIAMEAISDNLDRQKVVSFVDYGYTTPAAYVLDGNADLKDILDLCGRTGGAQSGTEYVDVISHHIAPDCAKAGKPEPKAAEYGSADAVLLSLYSGRVDFVVTDSASAQEIKKNAPKPVRVLASKTFPRPMSGIVFRKNETDLGEALLAAVEEVMADGTYDAIYTKWDVLPMRLDVKPGINLETGNPMK